MAMASVVRIQRPTPCGPGEAPAMTTADFRRLCICNSSLPLRLAGVRLGQIARKGGPECAKGTGAVDQKSGAAQVLACHLSVERVAIANAHQPPPAVRPV